MTHVKMKTLLNGRKPVADIEFVTVTIRVCGLSILSFELFKGRFEY